MKALSALGAGLLVALVAVGCGGGGVGDAVKDHSAYTLESSFDVQGDFGESGVGTVLNMLRDMSDDDDDPGRYVVQQVIDFLPTPLSWAAKPLEGVLAGQVNGLITSAVPTAAAQAKAVAQGMSQAARQFEMSSRLEVGLDAEDRYTGKHQVEKMVYSYQGGRIEVTREELGDDAPPAVRIPIHIDGDVLTIESHRLKLPVGRLLQKALDQLVIPSAAQQYLDLVGLIARLYACADIAGKIADTIGGGAAEVLAACVSSATDTADVLKKQLAKADPHGALRLEGKAEDEGSSYRGRGWSGAYVLGEDNEAALDPERCPFDGEKVFEAQ